MCTECETNTFQMSCHYFHSAKMLDYKVVTPFHRVFSNEASLTCSKAFSSVLNRSGISFSYVKDLKDCKYARQLWNSFGAKYSKEKISSSINWRECDN